MPLAAFAGGDDIDVRQSNDQNTITSTAGDLNIAGDKANSWGLGLAGGDVDIGQCVYHKSALVATWGKYNIACIARAYAEAGNQVMYAKWMCELPLNKELFKGDLQGCKDAHPLPKIVCEPPDEPPPSSADEEDNDYAELLARIEKVEKKKAPKPVHKTIVEQRPVLEEQDIAAIQELLK